MDEEWPLMLVDLKGQSRSIALKPGEMLLYESGKVIDYNLKLQPSLCYIVFLSRYCTGDRGR